MPFDPNDPAFALPKWEKVPPWCEHERWELYELGGKVWAKVTGRELAPAELKKSWAWGLRNDFEEQLPEWYKPEWPLWRRRFYWTYLRNPAQNWRCFVQGVCDRNYTVEVLEGHPSPFVIQRDDVGQQGYQKARLHLDDDTTRDFWSYTSDRGAWGYGWQPTGFFWAKINFR